MKKDKSGERFGKRTEEKPFGEDFVARKAEAFQIGPNSNPNKVARWLRRGGGSPIVRPHEKIRQNHIHPRHLRRRYA